jgi:MEMO1 family protein
MPTRERMLPVGWYPASAAACKAEIERFIAGTAPLPAGTTVYGGIVPHAGWGFSGKAAARVFYLTAKVTQPQVVCVFGGHLGGNSPPLLVTDEAWETPLGDLSLATEFYAPLARRLTLGQEYPGDNTIEVQMPFIKYFFPQAKALALRSPQSPTAIDLGQAVAAVAKELNVSILAFGSTDLTHYGPNYGFAPGAVQWVKEVNDKKFIDAALKLDGPAMLETALANQNACSPGGAVTAVTIAKEEGAKKAALVDYYTSYDIMPGESFVGYAGIVLEG